MENLLIKATHEKLSNCCNFVQQIWSALSAVLQVSDHLMDYECLLKLLLTGFSGKLKFMLNLTKNFWKITSCILSLTILIDG